MWKNLMDFTVDPVNLGIRAVIVYVAVLILLRISGKRQMGQMSATEFVVILLISNAVQNAMNGGDISLSGGLVSATVLIILSTTIGYLTYRSRFFSRLFEGTPTLLVHNGKVIHKHLRAERMNESDLQILLRKQGLHHLREIGTAILEADGTLSITKMEEPPAAREPV